VENNLSNKLNFFLFLIERYACHKGVSAGAVIKKWDHVEITQIIFEGYPEYHTERIENAFRDIDNLMATVNHAW